MTTEQNQTLAALQYAIRMETDGKEYYLTCSRESRDGFGKKLLAALAAAEDIHRQRFEEIFRALQSKKAWPEIQLRPSNAELKTIFAAALQQRPSTTAGPTNELEAVKRAIEMEAKSYDYYKDQGKAASYGTQRDFYEKLAAEEREHHLALLDYQEYLGNPAGWFAKTERPSLDGA